MLLDGKFKRQGCGIFAPITIFAIGIPSLIIAHEIGHLFVASALGYPAQLTYAAVDFIISKENSLGLEELLITLGGPLANLILASVGVFGLHRLSKAAPPSKTQWNLIWLLSVLVSGGGRGIMKIFSPEGSDEAFLADYFGLPKTVGVLILAIPSLFFMFYLFRFHYRKCTLLPLLSGWAAGIIGMFLWLKVIGPSVLPNAQETSEQQYGVNHSAAAEFQPRIENRREPPELKLVETPKAVLGMRGKSEMD